MQYALTERPLNERREVFSITLARKSRLTLARLDEAAESVELSRSAFVQFALLAAVKLIESNARLREEIRNNYLLAHESYLSELITAGGKL